MKIEGTYTFDAPRSEVWAALLDPEVLKKTLPGCERLELVGENHYEATLKIRVGPVQGAFDGKVQLEDIVELESYTMKVDGQGAPGFVSATALVRLEADGEKTVLGYDSDAKVGGRIAGVGQRLLDSSAKAVIRQSLEGLNGVVSSRSGAAPGAEPVRAPSQSEFAARVAKDVAKDLVPPPVRWGLAVAAALLALWVLWMLFA